MHVMRSVSAPGFWSGPQNWGPAAEDVQPDGALGHVKSIVAPKAAVGLAPDDMSNTTASAIHAHSVLVRGSDVVEDGCIPSPNASTSRAQGGSPCRAARASSAS